MDAGATIAHITSPADRARQIAPLLEANAARIDADRALTPAVLDALHGAGLFRTLLPRRFGGEEVTPAAFVRMQIELARGDASTAWCLGQGLGCSLVAGFLDSKVAHEIGFVFGINVHCDWFPRIANTAPHFSSIECAIQNLRRG